MPIKFPCRNCKQKLKASSRIAGRPFTCPHCGHKQRAPSPRPAGAAPSSADLAGVPTRNPAGLLEDSDPPPARRPQLAKPQPGPAAGPSPGALPFDDDEWDNALNPFEAPQEDSRAAPASYVDSSASSKGKELRWVRRGLMLLCVGIWGGYVCRFVERMAYRFGGLEEIDGPNTFIFVVLIIGAFFTALTAIGPFLCITVPERVVSRRTALTAATAQGVFVIGEVYLSFINEAETSLEEVTGLSMLCLCAVAVSYLTFVNFMQKLAAYIGRSDLVDNAKTLIALGIANFLILVATPICLYIGLTVDDMGWLLAVAGFCAFAIWFGLLAAFFNYAGLVQKLASAMPRG